LNIRTSNFERDDCALSYREREGSGGTLVFLHGSGFSKEIFDRQFGSDRLKDYRLIAVDLPGHGGSADAEDPATHYTFSGFARAIEHLLVRLGVEQCVVVGWSLGGHVALQMASSRPLVKGVVTLGTAPIDGGPLGMIRSMHFSKALLLAGKAQFSEEDAVLFEQQCLEHLAQGRFVSSLMRTDPHMRPSLSKAALTSFGPGQYAQMMESEVEICLIHGCHDPFIRTNYMKSLRGPSLYGGGAILFEDSGHAPFLDAQEEFESLLCGFYQGCYLRRHPAAPSLRAA